MKNNFIIWKKEWGTGIKKIDEQHKHYFSILNKTYALNKKGKDKIVLRMILNDLTEYARIHFSTEEEYFDETNYPSAKEHMEEHAKLLNGVIDFGKRFEIKEDVFKLVKDFLDFLKDWWDNHLLKTDHKYIPWLTEHGIR